MAHARRVVAFVVILAGLLLTACAQPTVEAAPEAAVIVEPVEGTDLARIGLSEHAAARLDIQTEPVGIEPGAGGDAAVVPFASMVYDADGKTWVYTNPEPLVFIRHEISVVRVDGDVALLSGGPAPGTLVVTVGAAELYGAETGVGGGH